MRESVTRMIPLSLSPLRPVLPQTNDQHAMPPRLRTWFRPFSLRAK